MEGYHKSVLLKEAVDALIPAFGGVNIRDAYWYLDLTLGDGGHSIEVISRGGRIVGIDVDPQALKRVQNRFKDIGIADDRYKLILGNFRDLNNLRKQQTDIAKLKFKGAIFDLGVSSLQLETPQRGFSFAKLGPIDMRMDPDLTVTALDLINALSRKELYELFRNLGEEKYSWQLADALVRAREVKPLKTTVELAEIIGRAVREGVRGKINPATRAFQALRIAVNDELEALKEGLEQVKEAIAADGRIAVISFHSLEDRIVKNTFKKWETEGVGEIVTKKPLVPSELEVEENPRARSAKMRVFRIYDHH